MKIDVLFIFISPKRIRLAYDLLLIIAHPESFVKTFLNKYSKDFAGLSMMCYTFLKNFTVCEESKSISDLCLHVSQKFEKNIGIQC